MRFVVEPERGADGARLGIALATLRGEDAELEVDGDEESGQTLIGGSGERQLDRIVERLRDEFGIPVRVGAVQVCYLETFARAHEEDFSHKRRFDGKGEFARVRILFEPNPDGADVVLSSGIEDGALPADYVASVENGLRSVLSSGPMAGFPLVGFKATLVDAAFHDTDSSSATFQVAARACLRASVAAIHLLEPIMAVEVVSPGAYVRDVIGEMRSRGRLSTQTIRGPNVVIGAIVPLARMFKLEDTLGSLSSGQAVLRASYAGHAPVDLPDDDGLPPAMAIRA